MRERRFAGVIALHGQQVVLVRDRQPQWDHAHWVIPSGAVEEHETPVAGAVRELVEETGLRVPETALRLVGTSATTGAGVRSLAWNFATTVTDPALAVADPDGTVTEARWFALAEAVELLGRLPDRPLAEPVLAFLDGGAGAEVTHWTYASPDAEPVRVAAPGG